MALLLFFTLSFNLEAEDHSAEIYKDHNDYFAAIMPAGWTIKDYPAENIRSKVKFLHPSFSGVNIGIIAGPSPQSPYSLEDVLAENRGKSDQIKRKIPGAKFTVNKEKLTDRDAVISRIERGGSEMKTVTFIHDDMFFQITLNTNSVRDRTAVSSTFEKFLRSFAIAKSGQKFSEEDRKSMLMSRYKSLAKLHEEMGKNDEALKYVEEGLAIDPNNNELQNLRAKLRGN